MELTGKSAQIIVRIEGHPETVIELDERLTIGRSAGNQLVLDDQNSSRRHAEIRHVGTGRYRIFDVGSANGTWLNGRRLTIPKDLENGDLVAIGAVILKFVAADSTDSEEIHTGSTTGAGLMATAMALRNEVVVILVCDIRNYTSMSEVLPSKEFSRMISEWFRDASEIIERHSGTVDKFIGDAVMAYWIAPKRDDPSTEVNSVLAAARDMLDRAKVFSHRLSKEFPGHVFRVGVGINLGEAVLGNVGTGENQSFTVLGDSVNIAFRLESLSKEKECPVITSQNVVDCASSQYRFFSLGEAEVKGRREPISIWALDLEKETIV